MRLSRLNFTRKLINGILRDRPLQRFRCAPFSMKAFWNRAAEDVEWFKKGDEILDTSRDPFSVWFPGHRTNTCFNCLDRHLQDRGDQNALIYDSPMADRVTPITYNELYHSVMSLAAFLKDTGIKKGSRVMIYMPNIPEAVIAMLATVRLGAIHCVVFDGFASEELAKRIVDCKPELIICASFGYVGKRVDHYKPKVDAAIVLASKHAPTPKCIVYNRLGGPEANMVPYRDYDWEEVMEKYKHLEVPCAVVSSAEPSYILYTSGTTGEPKGIVRDTGGHLVSLKWSMWNVYGLNPGDVIWTASDIGWAVGHSYTVYGPLLHGCTSVLYEGKPTSTPDERAYWRVAERHKVNVLFTSPTAIRSIKRLDPLGVGATHYNLSSLRALFLAGERADPDTVKWAETMLDIPVRDHWWQTETGWPICSNMVGLEGYQPVKYGSVFRSCPGWDMRVLGANNEELPPGQFGDLCAKLPAPPGFMLTLYNKDDECVKTYFEKHPGYYDTSDAGTIDDDGYVSVMSRTDDIINVSGHRVSTGSVEEILTDHHEVIEAAVIGKRDLLKGHVPVALLVCSFSGTHLDEPMGHGARDERICAEVTHMVREKLSPITCFHRAIVVPRLPKTRSGKILRSTLKAIANNDPYTVPATCEDPSVCKQIEEVIRVYETSAALKSSY